MQSAWHGIGNGMRNVGLSAIGIAEKQTYSGAGHRLAPDLA